MVTAIDLMEAANCLRILQKPSQALLNEHKQTQAKVLPCVRLLADLLASVVLSLAHGEEAGRVQACLDD